MLGKFASGKQVADVRRKYLNLPVVRNFGNVPKFESPDFAP